MANNAAGYQPATELPVVGVGGSNGTDPPPTLWSSSGSLLAEGNIHHLIASQIMSSDSGSEAATENRSLGQIHLRARHDPRHDSLRSVTVEAPQPEGNP